MKSAEEIIKSIEKLYEYEDAYGLKKSAAFVTLAE